MKRVTTFIGAMILAALPLAAMATFDESGPLGPKQVRAKVVNVDPQQNKLQVRVVMAGDEEAAKPGELETFTIGDNVPIEFRVDSVLFALWDYKLDELHKGDELVIQFENDSGIRHATKMLGDTRNTEMSEHARRSGRQVQEG
jgi:hypothetical protein